MITFAAADATNLNFEGVYSRHNLMGVPQVEALRDNTVIRELLSKLQYWQVSALEDA